MTEILYPWGYQKALVPEERLWQLARFDLMEPETAERFKAYIRSRNGQMGIGGAVRFVQPVKQGFAEPGRSFHELQEFLNKLKWFVALDIVMRNGTNVHRSPRWDEVPKQGTKHSDITDYGIHANVNGEPWHHQPIEIDGWATWAKNGRPLPNGNFPIKGKTTAPPAPAPKPGAIAPGSRTLRLASPSMRGADVQWVQNFLRNEGLILSADGLFGRQTRDRVRTWQGRNGHTADGVVGPKTWAGMLKK